MLSAMEPTQLLPAVALISIVAVEYGGWALLNFLTSKRDDALTDAQLQFFRAGHAHAGVLLVLSLVYFAYLDTRTEFREAVQWITGGILLLGVLAQSGGFFLHMVQAKGEARSSNGTVLTRVGAALIAVALIALAVGILGKD
jgi:hypothetical protein